MIHDLKIEVFTEDILNRLRLSTLIRLAGGEALV